MVVSRYGADTAVPMAEHTIVLVIILSFLGWRGGIAAPGGERWTRRERDACWALVNLKNAGMRSRQFQPQTLLSPGSGKLADPGTAARAVQRSQPQALHLGMVLDAALERSKRPVALTQFQVDQPKVETDAVALGPAEFDAVDFRPCVAHVARLGIGPSEIGVRAGG